MQAQQTKQQINIWGIIQPMMEEEAKQIKGKAQYLKRPHFFKDYPIKNKVRQIYQYFKDIKLIPSDMHDTSCYFNVQVVKKFILTEAKTSQMMISENIKEMMIIQEDKEEIIKNFQLKREENYQKILQEAQKKENGLFFCRNFSQTLEEIVTKILGTCQNFEEKFQLRIYFIWKHYQFTFLKSTQPLRLIGFYQQNYDRLFRRAIQVYPPFRQMLKQMTQWQGVCKRQLNFKKLRIYSNIENDKEYNYKPPNAKICLSQEGIYFLKIIQKQQFD